MEKKIQERCSCAILSVRVCLCVRISFSFLFFYAHKVNFKADEMHLLLHKTLGVSFPDFSGTTL